VGFKIVAPIIVAAKIATRLPRMLPEMNIKYGISWAPKYMLTKSPGRQEIALRKKDKNHLLRIFKS